MNIPHYWARVVGTDADLVPGMVVYGWSDTSVEDARMLARERMQRFAEIVTRADGKWIEEYPYPKKPLREEIIKEWSTGGATNVVTRNSYGSLVLNTDRVVIIDVDLPRLGFFESIKRLFTGGGGDEQVLLDRLQVATDSLGCSMRLYRTRAGYRGIVTDRTGEPGDSFTDEFFAATGTDKQYARLCRVQKSYRARLTPKHWRLGVAKPPKQVSARGAWRYCCVCSVAGAIRRRMSQLQYVCIRPSSLAAMRPCTTSRTRWRFTMSIRERIQGGS